MKSNLHPPKASHVDAAHTGLAQDLINFSTIQHGRRRMLGMLAVASVAPASLVACMGRPPMGEKNQHPDALSGSCTVIPAETQGPFPSDGTNGANALTIAGMVRRDIRATIASTGAAAGIAAGVPLTIQLQLKLGAQNCSAFAGYAVYI